MSTWNPSDLQAIADSDDFRVAPLRADGTTLGTPTFIWSVVVEGQLYIRAATGQHSSWYQAARDQGAGQVHAAGQDRDVTFTTVDDADLGEAIDAAYRAKYQGMEGLREMQLPQAVAATVQVTPRP